MDTTTTAQPAVPRDPAVPDDPANVDWASALALAVQPSEAEATPAQQPAAPGDLAAPDGLRIYDWLDTSNPDLELEEYDIQTVGDVRQAFHGLYLNAADYDDWGPAIFVGEDGRVYAAEVVVVVRPATPGEVREGVEAEKELALRKARSRVETVEGYLKAAST